MNRTDEQFRQRLLATFSEEAEEHLGAITEGLIRLEKVGLDASPKLVESIYRMTHSLKGAAHAVNLPEIVSVCQGLENVFSVMKQGRLSPDANTFDLLHQAVKVVKCLLADKGKTDVPHAEIIRALKSVSGAVHSGGSPEHGEFIDRKISIPEAPLKLITDEESRDDSKDESIRQDSNGATVRIAANKLDRLIAGADDLLTTRLFITQRTRELEEMMARFTLWRWKDNQLFNDLHLLRDTSFVFHKSLLPPEMVLPLQRIVEFLQYNSEFVTYLHHDLAAHIRATEMDRAALEASTSEISDLIHDAVLLPFLSILTPISEFLREFSRNSGKTVDLRVEGERIELDRRILEAIKDPLLHLIRNSIDHGIEYPEIRAEREKPERGLVKIRIFPLSGSKVGIEVSDDGAGIDIKAIRDAAVEKRLVTAEKEAKMTEEEAIRLIFRSGLSTSPIITDISGRGLGLPIVVDTITRLEGDVKISSVLGEGTSLTMTVPLKLATFRGVLVKSGRQVYVFPKQQVKRVVPVTSEEIFSRGNRLAISHHGETIDAIRLSDAMGIEGYSLADEEIKHLPLVIIAYGAGQIGFIVDEVISVQEIVVRSMGSQLRRVKRIAGAAILGDGSLALILDPLELIEEAIKSVGPVLGRGLFWNLHSAFSLWRIPSRQGPCCSRYSKGQDMRWVLPLMGLKHSQYLRKMSLIWSFRMLICPV